MFDASVTVAETARPVNRIATRGSRRDRRVRAVLRTDRDLSMGTTVAREALLRWRHPLRGLLPPSDFLALLEESERVVPLGEWVLAALAGMPPRGQTRHA